MKLTKSYSKEEWNRGNLVKNGDFSEGSIGSMPDGWKIVCPNPTFSPIFKLVNGQDNKPIMMGAGNGRIECFGYICQNIYLEPNKTYAMRVRLKFEGLDDINHNLVHGVFGQFNDGIFKYYKQGNWVIGEGVFSTPDKPLDTELRMYFRFSTYGKVWWEHITIQECDPIPERLVKVACSWGTGDLNHWSRWLDIAGKKKVDIALLPEVFNGKNVKDAEHIDGTTGNLLSEKASKWKMYVSGTFYEKREDLIFNSAPIYNREGKLIGIYSKNQLYDPEEDEGATPGIGFPVFETDFGKIGIIICYDSWFPEPVRLLAYKGAELILFPNAGYFMGLMPARSADNGVCIAVSSLNCPAGIWDSSGTLAGEEQSDPTRYAPSSIKNFEKDEENRMITATLDLNKKYSPHWWGGPMRSAPGGRRCRQTLIVPIEKEIAKEAQRWWED